MDIQVVMVATGHLQIRHLLKSGQILAEPLLKGVAVQLALSKLLQHLVHHPALPDA
ncbi:Uncharacterised protein [Serratia quinivorans]|nr:Uncharacterised protein [Serratia quinivorans]CAI1988896.1 Uncharacterised protein [Serratia quinivorans]